MVRTLKYSDGGKPHYANRGKPKPDAIPSISYRIATVIARRRNLGTTTAASRFILATNILDSAQFSKDDALREYKAQQATSAFVSSLKTFVLYFECFSVC
jgi:hypothetical protein